jgi:hypothetical protein
MNWQAKPRSSFGHSAIIVDGMSYSFGPDGMDIKPANDFLGRNTFRSAVGLEISITPSQASDLSSFLTGFKDSYSALRFSTCVQPVVYALGTIGISVGTPVFPVSLGNAVLNTGSVTQTNFYNQSTPREKPWYYPTHNAPWAR